MRKAEGREALSRYLAAAIDLDGPEGQVSAGPDFSGEAIRYADVDMAEIMGAKHDFDVAGHYARPDVLQLSADTSRKSAVKAG